MLAVGLVDRDDVGHLEDAALDALQLVAAAGERQQEEGVDHLGDRDLGLTDAHGLDEHDVEARGPSTSIPSRVARATPPRCAPDGDGRTKASSLAVSCAIRVRSPRTDPPVRELLGSTATTATR